MPVFFHDLQARCQGDLKQRSRELAKPAAERRYDATLTNLAAGNESADRPGRTDLPPQAEELARSKHALMQPAARHPQVLDLTQDEPLLSWIAGGVKVRDRFGKDIRKVRGRAWVQDRQAAPGVLCQAQCLQTFGSQEKRDSGKPGGMVRGVVLGFHVL